MQTREDRIRAHYKSLRRGGARVCCQKHWLGMNYHIWMPLARTWKMPIQEIKKIVRKSN